MNLTSLQAGQRVIFPSLTGTVSSVDASQAAFSMIGDDGNEYGIAVDGTATVTLRSAAPANFPPKAGDEWKVPNIGFWNCRNVDLGKRKGIRMVFGNGENMAVRSIGQFFKDYPEAKLSYRRIR